MAGHSIWNPPAPSASPTFNSIKPASHATPQATRGTSRFFFNASPGWNLTETASKPSNNGINDTSKLFGNGNTLKTSNQNSLFNLPTESCPRPSPPLDSTLQDFLSRHNQLKSLDGHKNDLIEELLYRYEFLSEQFKKVSDDNDREREYNRAAQRREKGLKSEIMRLQMHMGDSNPNRNSTIFVLIDGDGMTFKNELLQKGELGGREAAMLLHDRITSHLVSTMPELDPDTKIVARVYSNVNGLAEAFHQAGIVDQPSRIKEFAAGFTSGNSLFDFVDVGSHGRADVKVAELLNLHIRDYQCRQIILGCSPDTACDRLLRELAINPNYQDRFTLLEGINHERDSEHFNIPRIRTDGLFAGTRLNGFTQDSGAGSSLPSSANGVTLVSSSSSASALSRQLSEVDIKGVQDFTPRLPHASTTSISTDSAKPSPVFTWASAVAKPVTPVGPPSLAPVVATVPAASMPKDNIPRNRKGQRIDPIIKHDKAEVDRVKKLKMCNVHFLRGECPYGDSCSHVHQYKPTPAEIQTLRLVARMAPCMHGSECEEQKCIYGHICPAPEGRDGKDCIFGELCRFPAEMHKIDRQVVRTIKV